MTVLLATPRGFCAGVRRAIDAVRDALSIYGAPVYVRRPIVHNLDVVRALEGEGAIFVQELGEVPRGSVVVLSAHGVPPAVLRDARNRGLIAFDAVCPLVAKVHREVERHQRNGRHVIVIGHRGHPEIDGTVGHLPDGAASVVSSEADIDALRFAPGEPMAYAVQTTYSVDDAAQLVEALVTRFPDIEGPATTDICYATTNRQTAVRDIAIRADAVIVVGESFSSNATRLAEVASLLCPQVQLVARPDELDRDRLAGARVIGITAAASTPETSVQAIIDALAEQFVVSTQEFESVEENVSFKRLAVA
ncbi:MAG TPA: 4-hydroxy-3-methylbut-2-enyl diphosphate reductase [Sphingomicrobium sp.]